MAPQCLDVIKFQQRCDPFSGNPWRLDHTTTQNDIEIAIKANNLLPPGSIAGNKTSHIALIAWFVIHGWSDPINIDVGVPSLGCYPVWPLEDGNHRFAAAIIRGDHFILANMSGAVREIQKFLWKES